MGVAVTTSRCREVGNILTFPLYRGALRYRVTVLGSDSWEAAELGFEIKQFDPTVDALSMI